MSIADLYDALLIDLDGVVYVGHRAIPGVPEAIAELRARGKPVLFITNDTRASLAQCAAKLTSLGIPTHPHEVFTAGVATAAYLRSRHQVAGRTVFAIGSPAFKGELVEIGLLPLEGDEGRLAEFVAVAWHEDFHYRELRTAALAIRRGAHFYGANRDPVFPMPDGLWPAAGAVLAAVETAAGKPAIAVGKPEAPMFEMAKAVLPAGARCAIVGDRLDSDVLGGKRAGIGTVLALSGSTTREQLAKSDLQPDHVVDTLAGVL